jgi:hypothetical protein
MKNDPVYAAQIEKQRIEGIPGEPTMDPDTSQMMYGTPQKLNLKDVTPQGGGTGAGEHHQEEHHQQEVIFLMKEV